MATKNIFASMLNQKAIGAPQLKSNNAVKIQKPPGSPEFAYITPGNTEYKHPLLDSGKDIARSVWARMLPTNSKGGS